ncbi:alpha/beta fold hydrolase [Marinigracilibium pacificum]|uniref:Alpha/beta hydrolase n=1 Tax=Marinigracilibium pacificum TaxID=2729599 RepID=A0A848IYQ8_9BACT|nr:alpha/beta hydrolase [Marinigracilibium pacificum]NMM47374.1 alpha/beta hydrolase [Marinigracilibium pacificum]
MKKPLKASEGYIDADDHNLYYKVLGEGPCLLVLHGGPALDHSYLLEPFLDLAKTYKLVFFDQVACGKSSIPKNTENYSFANLVNDLNLVVDYLNIDSFGIIAHSWGSLLALEYAKSNSDLVKSIIFSNPMSLCWDDWQMEQQILDSKILKADLIKRKKILQSDKMRKNPSLMVGKLMRISFKPHFYNEDYINDLNLNIPDDYLLRSEFYERIISENQGFDLFKNTDSLSIPSLIIYGEIEAGKEISGDKFREVLTDSTLKEIKHSGHFPFIENPTAYFKAVDKFQARLLL